MNQYHKSVLEKEALDWLRVKPGKLYIDATAGGGGHTSQIIKSGGKVLALDQDIEAIEYLKTKKLENLTLVNGNFSHIYKIASDNGFIKVAGILFDLGVSSHQLENPGRGFSFQKEGPLDMRMDPRLNITAFDLVNNFDKRRLNEIFRSFGQEKFSLAIADAIVSARQIEPINSTSKLSKIVHEVYRKKGIKTKLDPATKVFQALRIVVNSELLNLKETLPQTIELLETGGRLVVISFHSLEDAIVKRFFKQTISLKVLTKKPVGPSSFEIANNPRSRSAKLRVAEKIVI